MKVNFENKLHVQECFKMQQEVHDSQLFNVLMDKYIKNACGCWGYECLCRFVCR